MFEFLVPMLERLIQVAVQRVMAGLVVWGIIGLLLEIIGIIAAVVWVKRRKELPAEWTSDYRGKKCSRWEDDVFAASALFAIVFFAVGTFILLMQLHIALSIDYEALRELRSLIKLLML